MKSFFLILLLYLLITCFDHPKIEYPKLKFPTRIQSFYQKFFQKIYKYSIKGTIFFGNHQIQAIIYRQQLEIPLFIKDKKKVINLKQIKLIQILSWKSFFLKSQNEKTQFIFIPTKWKIQLFDSSKKTFIYQKRIPSLESLVIFNETFKKKSRIYSIYYDYWLKKEKRWEIVKKEKLKNNQLSTVGHPDNFKKIIFHQ